ncbi:MAG: lysostaphin resistance A-like protein [Cyanophyceae cyanobacterium]
MVDLVLQRLLTVIVAHSLLKVALFLLVWAIAWLPLAIPLARVVEWNPARPITTKQKLILLASLYSIAPALVWIAVRIEGKQWQDYGFVWHSQLFVSLALGTGCGFISILAIFAGQSLFGWVRWHFEGITWMALPLLGIGIAIAAIEELVFRGFILDELGPYSYGRAAALSSLIFACLHLVWEQKQTLPQLPGLWLMGMVLAEARLADGGSLGLAWGLHAGWIWGLSTLDACELVTYTGKASAWMTGLGKQPLAGAVGILYLLATGGLLLCFSPAIGAIPLKSWGIG